MSTVRTEYIRGPAFISFAGTKFISKGGVTVRHNIGVFRPETDLYGPLAARVGERMAEVSFTPIGTFTQGECDLLWPLHNYSDYVGASIFGAGATAANASRGAVYDDTPATRLGAELYIQGRDGRRLTYAMSAVSKMPDITFSATKTLIGGVTLMALGDGGTGASGWKDTLFAEAASAWANPAVALNPYTQPYSVTLAGGAATGFANFTNVETTDGFTVSFGESTDNHPTDAYGVADVTWSQIEPVVSFTPVNYSAASLVADFWAKMQGAGSVSRGGILPPAVAGSTLTLVGRSSATGLSLVMANPALTESGFQFDTRSSRQSGMQFAFSRFASDDIPFRIVGA